MEPTVFLPSLPEARAPAPVLTADGVVEVVDDHGQIAGLQQLQHGVTADVASPARHQHLLRHRTWPRTQCQRGPRLPAQGLRLIAEGIGRVSW